jgi:hypothetical protein
MLDKIADSFAMLSQVQSFYDSAWNRLLYFVTGAIGVVGVIVPITIQLIQNNAFRRETKRLGQEADKRLSKMMEVLKNEMSEYVERKTAEIKKLSDSTHCGVFLVQANLNLSQKEYVLSMYDYNSALSYAIDAEDYLNVGSVIEGFKILLNRHLNKSHFEPDGKLLKAIESDLELLSTELGERYWRESEHLRKSLKEAIEREPESK